MDGLEEVLHRDPAQLAVAGRGSSMHELKAELAEYGDRIGVILSRSTLVGDYWCMEIVPAGVSKAKALAFLGERYGIGAERMIAIGDNFNDLDMIEYAGLGVAMGNAPDAVRRAADLVARIMTPTASPTSSTPVCCERFPGPADAGRII